MIANVRLLHYLTEDTYRKIALKLNLSCEEQIIKANYRLYKGQKVNRVSLFNIIYKDFGHIWFMCTHVDFEKFDCRYADFESELFGHYKELFGEDIMAEFPKYDEINCEYVEYVNTITVNNSDKSIKALHSSGCLPEQLDKELWDRYSKPNATIEFCLAKLDDTKIETLARCHGTALKRRIDKSFHRNTGITPSKIINSDTERDILKWLRGRYKI